MACLICGLFICILPLFLILILIRKLLYLPWNITKFPRSIVIASRGIEKIKILREKISVKKAFLLIFFVMWTYYFLKWLLLLFMHSFYLSYLFFY